MPASVLKVVTGHVANSSDVRLYLGGTTGTTDNRLLRCDGTGGYDCQSSAASLDDSGNLSGVGTVSCGAITTTGTLAVTGSITVTANVDGRDVSVDGTKLDGIEAAADVTDDANVRAALAAATADIAINTHKITGLSAGTASGHAVEYDQWQTAGSYMHTWGTTVSPNTTSTRYLQSGAHETAMVANERNSVILATQAFTARRVSGYHGTAVTTANHTYTLQKNGTNTTLTFTINGGAQTGNDGAHSAAFAADDRVSMACVASTTDTTGASLRVSMGGSFA